MRALREVAVEILADWTVINNAGAREALEYMREMGVVTERFGADPNGYAVVSALLINSIGWRGSVARRIKKELRQMCDHPRP
ncbi:hypothetical protein [Castellaniella sp.]|uniref:hypothetical protein n=1 Tax=Castellaniella sp. TaxID=1955812 RepID=UPI003560FA79